MVLMPHLCKSGKYAAGPWAGMKPEGRGDTGGIHAQGRKSCIEWGVKYINVMRIEKVLKLNNFSLKK